MSPEPFKAGFLSAGFTQFASPAIGHAPGGVGGELVAAGVVGGVGSELAGGKFEDGFVTGVFGRAFNHGLHSNGKKWFHKLGERLRGNGIRNLINEHSASIDSAAAKHGVDGNLIRGIIYEEQTHQLPGEGILEQAGFGDTVGLGQITISGQSQYSRAELLDLSFDMNIDATAAHLARVQTSSNAMTATAYNCGSCTSVTPYGIRVNHYTKHFSNGFWP